MITTDVSIHHDLTGPHSVWLTRYNDFQKKATEHQVQYKKNNWPHIAPGLWSKSGEVKHYYPHILPDSEVNRKLVLYPPIADKVHDYCKQKHIEMHSEFLNLKSSQVCCFNFLFALRENRAVAAQALFGILPDIDNVEWIDFEYTGGAQEKELNKYLGEPKAGKRGANRTSIDAAICWRDAQNRKNLTLIEWKYTESQLGTCGGYASSGNKDKAFCRSNPLLTGDISGCYLTKDRNHRRYWEHLSDAGMNVQKLKTIPGCPFRGPFYQLFRQFLVASFLRQTGEFDNVEVMLLRFGDNNSVTKVPRELRSLGGDIVEAWNGVLDGTVSDFRDKRVECLAEGIRSVKNFEELGRYLGERYVV